ncbi:putative cyclin-D7-1 [Diospyros lotus]|uniref:putative cyclin-D7-1 n=1 Tax=Diospyros lotus TaxID=55363 RepID=UPI002253C423|nr:putative cyclin-D7-1 [Diospyros lotus]
MDHSLLCDEVWLMSAPKPESHGSISIAPFDTTEEDYHQAFAACLQKEATFLPQSGYQHLLQSASHLNSLRLKAMQWLVKRWENSMVELVAIACLSVASKFGETTHPSLHEIQMKDLDHSFQSSLIQRMELTLLKALGWRLGSVTPYSYVEPLLIWNRDALGSSLFEELTAKLTKLLLSTLSDSRFLEFRPCVTAISALRCIIEDSAPLTNNPHLAHVTNLIPEDQKDYLIKCDKIMEEKLVHPTQNLTARRCCCYCCCPSSSVTFVTMEQVDEYHCQLELPLLKMPAFNIINHRSSKMKRKRELE